MNPPPLPFTRLEVVNDPTPRGAALNMALDEVLLGGLDDDPVLRIYRWERRAVSIGYFEAFKDAAGRWAKRDLVRRWTGGGIVEHGDDLTFSLLVPRALPLAMLPAAESYRVIHLAVAHALTAGGVTAGVIQTSASTPVGPGSHACFERPVQHDLMLDGCKIAGGAQRRTRCGLLHQASLRLARQTGLIEGLPQAFSRSHHLRVLTAADLDAAASLAATKYGTAAWQQRF